MQLTLSTKLSPLFPLVGVFVLAMAAVSPLTAYADIVQGTHDSETPSIQFTATEQVLGTGITGTMTQADFYVNDQYTPYTDYIAFVMCEYATESDYDPASAYCGGTTLSTTGITPGYSGGGTGEKLATWTGSYVFDPTHFYVLAEGGNYNSASDLRIRGSATDTWGGGDCNGAGCSPLVDFYFYLYGVSGGGGGGGPSGSCLDGDFGTCINEVQPADGDTVATSSPTTIGATGYIDPSDFLDGRSRIRFKLDRQTDSQAVGALIGWESAFGNWTTIDVDSDGAFDVSTTSIESLLGANREGEWNMRTVIQVPDLVLFGIVVSWKEIESYNSDFVYGALTGVDIIHNAGEDVLEAVLGSADPFANCQFDFSTILDFSEPDNVLTCTLGIVSSLIVPSQQQLVAIMDSQKNEFLSKPPFGYVYLAGRSLLGYSNVATSTLSASNLTITFPATGAFASSSAGSVAGQTITFIDWDQVATGLQTSEVSTSLSPFYDFINLFMTAGFLFWLWRFGTRFMTP